jgi:hypothetical protein
MTKKNYQNRNCDLAVLVQDVQSWFTQQGYQVQFNKAEGAWIIQAQKTETWRKVVGASRAFNMLIEGYPNNFCIELGTGEWASNLAAVGVGTLLTGGVSLIGSGLAAGWSKKIEGDIWNFIDQKVIFGERAKSNIEIAVLKTQESLEDKLRQLKEVFEQNLIDEATYNSKRKEFENQSVEQKKNNEINEKLMKLKNALDSGILSQTEYEAKKSELMARSSNTDLENKLAQLKSAFATGILSQEEFDKKAADIQREITLSEKLKQLEGARNAGIITNEEFEQKKSQILAINS